MDESYKQVEQKELDTEVPFCIVGFHFYEVLEQAKQICGDGSQNSGHLVAGKY
jgi:hypothetical protein